MSDTSNAYKLFHADGTVEIVDTQAAENAARLVLYLLYLQHEIGHIREDRVEDSSLGDNAKNFLKAALKDKHDEVMHTTGEVLSIIEQLRMPRELSLLQQHAPQLVEDLEFANDFEELLDREGFQEDPSAGWEAAFGDVLASWIKDACGGDE